MELTEVYAPPMRHLLCHISYQELRIKYSDTIRPVALPPSTWVMLEFSLPYGVPRDSFDAPCKSYDLPGYL